MLLSALLFLSILLPTLSHAQIPASSQQEGSLPRPQPWHGIAYCGKVQVEDKEKGIVDGFKYPSLPRKFGEHAELRFEGEATQWWVEPISQVALGTYPMTIAFHGEPGNDWQQAVFLALTFRIRDAQKAGERICVLMPDTPENGFCPNEVSVQINDAKDKSGIDDKAMLSKLVAEMDPRIFFAIGLSPCSISNLSAKTRLK